MSPVAASASQSLLIPHTLCRARAQRRIKMDAYCEIFRKILEDGFTR
jgi:hypothetical protein